MQRKTLQVLMPYDNYRRERSQALGQREQDHKHQQVHVCPRRKWIQG